MCFSLASLEGLLIWAVVIAGLFAIVRLLLVPLVLAPLGQPGSIIIGVLNILLWVAVSLLVIYVVFDLLACVLSGPHLRVR